MNRSWRDIPSDLDELELISRRLPQTCPLFKPFTEPDKRRLGGPGRPRARWAKRLHREMDEIYENPPE